MTRDFDSLRKVVENLKEQNIDLSAVLSLADYISAHPEKADEKPLKLDIELLEAIVPMLQNNSIIAIFARILDGDLPSELIKPLIPYAPYLVSQIESAVLLGALEKDVLEILREY
ncbi:MAG: hypothetical protein GX897_06330 [Clostridiales bacterium]|nr:hypothetical protein [Clostridiales bacterium]